MDDGKIPPLRVRDDGILLPWPSYPLMLKIPRMTRIDEIYRHINKQLTAGGIDSPDLEARIILKERAGVEWADIIARPELEITSTQSEVIQNDLARRLTGEPLSKIHGWKEFYGLRFTVTPDVLDPRPETEMIVDLALKAFAKEGPKRILDLGTGSGCLVLSLVKQFPGATALAVDISSAALKIAGINARAHEVDDRIVFRQGDWLEGIEESFDLIVANPPYIRESDIPNLESGVRNHDPILALAGGSDGLEPYKKIFPALKRVLKPGGKAFLEMGAGQGDDLVRLAGESGLCAVCVHLDNAGLTRVVEISSGDN